MGKQNLQAEKVYSTFINPFDKTKLPLLWVYYALICMFRVYVAYI